MYRKSNKSVKKQQELISQCTDNCHEQNILLLHGELFVRNNAATGPENHPAPLNHRVELMLVFAYKSYGHLNFMIYVTMTAAFWAAFLNYIKIDDFYPELFPAG